MRVSVIKTDKWLIIMVAIIYRYYLDLSYIMLSESYPVEFPVRPDSIKMVLSYVIISWLILITYKKDLITSYLFRVLTFFTIIPLSSVYAMKDESSVFFLLTCLTFGAVQLIFIKNHKTKEEIELSLSASKGVPLLRYSCLLFIALTAMLMYLQMGMPSLEALVLENVYEVRQNFNLSSYVRYMLWACAQVAVPFGIADGYVRKSKIQVVICILFQLMFYLWTGNKTWFFSIFLILAIMILIASKKKLDYFFIGLTVLCAVGYYGRENLVGVQVGSFLNRRVLLDPAALKFSYYDYFIVNSHDKVYFSSTVLGPLFRGLTKSSIDFPYDISDKYTDKASNAVTGIYGGDIANWGLLTFILVPVLLYMLADLAEKSKYKIGRNFTYLFLSYLFFSFNDQRIVIFFLDFQGLILFFILFEMTRNPQRHIKNKQVLISDN